MATALVYNPVLGVYEAAEAPTPEQVARREAFEVFKLVRRVLAKGPACGSRLHGVVYGSYSDQNSENLRKALNSVVDRDRLLDMITERWVGEVQDCYSCEESTWSQHTYTTNNDEAICVPCVQNGSWVSCGNCSYYEDADRTTYVEGWGSICRNCLDDFSYCDNCEAYYNDNDDHECNYARCDCEARQQRFTFPANGHGVLANDTRMTVTLPAGIIDRTGINEIHLLVNTALYEQWAASEDCVTDPFSRTWSRAANAVLDMDPRWQTTEGNFTKRLSKRLRAEFGVKMPPHLISQVGNLANLHSSRESMYHIEVTRNLNLPARAFGHEESCWWGGYARSRCALKDLGGLGLRTFEDDWHGDPHVAGRAWILPFDDLLEPTRDAANAHAYVVFNAYGNIDEYKAARIVAHLTDRSYKKISFFAQDEHDMYINNTTGFLIADQATCDNTTEIQILESWEHP